MFFKKAAVVAAAVGSAMAADNSTSMSICDKYTTALLKNNTAANQKTLLTLVVNTAVIGNYTKPNVGIKVPGILAAGEYNGTSVNLLPYFDGGLASTNRGNKAVSMNFLDDGGAAPLMDNMPSNGTDSAQYRLLTHLYEYFGALLGCSMMGTDAYPAYDGSNSMYNVHKFMDLSAAEFGYFVSQVALSAASFGVATEDLTTVGKALNAAFGMKNSMPMVIIPSQDAALQAICIGDGCPTASNSTTSGYDAAVEPSTAVSSLVPSSSKATGTATPAPTGTETMTGTATGTASGAGASATGTNAAMKMGINVAAVAGGLAALML